MSTNNTARIIKKETQIMQEDQKSIEKLKFLLKNAIQVIYNQIIDK